MHIEVDAVHLSVEGTTSSAAHDEIIRQTAADLFPQHEITMDLQGALATPPGWALTTELTLRALVETPAATATINAHRVHVSGVAENLQAWLLAARKIEDHLLPGMRLVTEVREMQPSSRVQKMCADVFQSALRGRSIAFPSSSDRIKTTAYGLLDELIQIVADCPGAHVAVTGHTDTTGVAAANQVLSEARARAVVAYMTQRGIPAERLSASGEGSANPVYEETDRHSRRLNRRIEFQLRFP